MKQFILEDIYSDGYERIASIREKEAGKEIIVHFLEYDEYLEKYEKSEKKTKGNILDGNLFVDLVNKYELTEEEASYKQTIPKSSHVSIVAEICQVIDDFSVMVNSTITDDKLLVEFEKKVNLNVGDRIHFEGSLELRMI